MNQNLFYITLLGPTLFLVVAFILGAITPKYRPLHNTISELALGKFKALHALNYVVNGSLIALLGLLLLSERSFSYGAAAVIVLGVIIVLSAIYKTDPIKTKHPTTQGNIHNGLFFVGMLGIISAQFVIGFGNIGTATGVFSLLCGLFTLILLPITVTRQTYMGLFQRGLVFVVMLWVTGFALYIH
jgi:hypothetical protein